MRRSCHVIESCGTITEVDMERTVVCFLCQPSLEKGLRVADFLLELLTLFGVDCMNL